MTENPPQLVAVADFLDRDCDKFRIFVEFMPLRIYNNVKCTLRLQKGRNLSEAV